MKIEFILAINYDAVNSESKAPSAWPNKYVDDIFKKKLDQRCWNNVVAAAEQATFNL